MRMKSNIDFSGVPKGTEGDVERDGDLWKMTWDLPERRSTKPLVDWFDEHEKVKFLEAV